MFFPNGNKSPQSNFENNDEVNFLLNNTDANKQKVSINDSLKKKARLLLELVSKTEFDESAGSILEKKA